MANGSQDTQKGLKIREGRGRGDIRPSRQNLSPQPKPLSQIQKAAIEIDKDCRIARIARRVALNRVQQLKAQDVVARGDAPTGSWSRLDEVTHAFYASIDRLVKVVHGFDAKRGKVRGASRGNKETR